MMSTTNADNTSCESVSHYGGNTTHVFLYDKYNGIPDTLIINLVAFVILLLLFTILRKIAWDYGRLALVNRTEENGAPVRTLQQCSAWTRRQLLKM